MPGFLFSSSTEPFDDDATIDQEFSSLTSYEEPPPPSRGGLDPPDSRLRAGPPVPSWASRMDSDDGSLEPRTVLPNLSRPESAQSGAKDLSGDREAPESHTVVPKASLDEVPVAGAKKSFHELLAEQLGCDVGAVAPPEPEEAPPEPAFVRRIPDEDGKPRTFLRKGSGLSRYGGVGSPPKSFKRSQSQNNVSQTQDGTRLTSASSTKMKSATSCSRLDVADKETIAFASKKTPPKRAAVSAKKPTLNGHSGPSSSGPGVGPKKSTTPPSSQAKPRITNGASPSVPIVSSKDSNLNRKKPAGATIKKGASALPVASKNSPSLNDKPDRKSNGHSNTAASKKGSSNGPVHTSSEELSPVYDSVEWSFREKLKKADKTHKVTTNIVKTDGNFYISPFFFFTPSCFQQSCSPTDTLCKKGRNRVVITLHS